MTLRFTSTLLFGSICCALFAQTWDEDYANELRHLRYHSTNPTRIAEHTQKGYAVAHVGYAQGQGGFHAVDASGKTHQWTAMLEGARQVGKFDVQGHLRYQHYTEAQQRWNSTLWQSPRNPFVLSDSVGGDVTTEAFDMQAIAVYTHSPRWRMGVEVGLRTGNRADQTDPRPRTATAIIPLMAGVEYQAGKAWSLGMMVGYRHQHALVEYYNVRSDRGHQYFLMKGMGDYVKRSVGDESGYKRDYAGRGYRLSAQATWQPTHGRWANFAEVRLSTTNEKATDGGTAYTFRGGDYSEVSLALYNRLRFSPTAYVHHHWAWQASYTHGQGLWYDQRRTIDPTYGVTLYTILNKSAIQHSHYALSTLQYTGEVTKYPDRGWRWGTTMGFHHVQRQQSLGSSTPTQRYQHLHLEGYVGKRLVLRRVRLLAQGGGGYRLPLHRTYAYGSLLTGAEGIEDTYVRPAFDYETAGLAHFNALADASLSLHKGLSVGLNVQLEHRICTHSEAYKGQHFTSLHVGTYLKF